MVRKNTKVPDIEELSREELIEQIKSLQAEAKRLQKHHDELTKLEERPEYNEFPDKAFEE